MSTGPAWYQVLAPAAAARVRLYALPSAGAGASMFRAWKPHVPEGVELRAVLLPGRQARHREPAFEEWTTAAAELARQLADEEDHDGVPYALFGHSMGAMIGYGAVRRLHADGHRLPVLFVAASWPVAGAESAVMPDPDADEETFCAVARRLGGGVDELLDDLDARRLVLPVMRSDFRLCRSYADRDTGPFPVPVSVYGGDDDPVTPAGTLTSWHGRAVSVSGPRLFPGGHFFFQGRVGETVAAVADDLAAVVPDLRATTGTP